MLIGSTDLGQQVRKYVLDHFLEFAVPPVVEQIMKRFRLDRGQAFEVLQWLEAARHVGLVPGTQSILMAFAFSAAATPCIVTLRNRRWSFDYRARVAVASLALLIEPV